VSVCAGTSISVAVAVKVNSTNSLTLLFPIDPKTGASFTAVTVIVIVAMLLSLVPSFTLKVKLSGP